MRLDGIYVHEDENLDRLTPSLPPSLHPLPTPYHSISLPRRLRARTPAHTALIPTAGAQPLLGAELELALQLGAGFLAVDEVAKPAAHAAFAAVEPAAGFAEVGHGRELAVDGAGGVPAAVEGVAGGLGGVFVFEAGVDVAD